VVQALASLLDASIGEHRLVIGYVRKIHLVLYSIVLGFLEDFHVDNLPRQLLLDQH